MNCNCKTPMGTGDVCQRCGAAIRQPDDYRYMGQEGGKSQWEPVYHDGKERVSVDHKPHLYTFACDKCDALYSMPLEVAEAHVVRNSWRCSVCGGDKMFVVLDGETREMARERQKAGSEALERLKSRYGEIKVKVGTYPLGPTILGPGAPGTMMGMQAAIEKMNLGPMVVLPNAVESEPDHVRRARCKVFQLSRRDLLHLSDCIIIPDFPAFPPDAVIEDCEFNPWTRCFVMRVWSSTFDPVPDGMSMPVVNEPTEMVCRAVKLTNEQKEQMRR